jgi:hypothetical protein
LYAQGLLHCIDDKSVMPFIGESVFVAVGEYVRTNLMPVTRPGETMPKTVDAAPDLCQPRKKSP